MRNLMKGRLVNRPMPQRGNTRYIMDNTGKNRLTDEIHMALKMTCRRRKPGKPSYHNDANNCWQFGCATNCKKHRTNLYPILHEAKLSGSPPGSRNVVPCEQSIWIMIWMILIQKLGGLRC